MASQLQRPPATSGGGSGSGLQSAPTPFSAATYAALPSKIPIDEIILAQPNATYRQAIADLRVAYGDLQRHATDLETELKFSRNRIAELDLLLKERNEVPVVVSAPVKSLEDLISVLKQQHSQQIEAMRRKSAEEVRTAEDNSFDAVLAIQQSASRSMKPPPKNFEFVDLLQMRDSILQEGYAPTTPLQAPLIQQFVSHVDSVRQCTKDNRFANMYRDPIRADTLRRIFDMAKAVEAKLGPPTHLTLPPQAVTFDASAYRNEEIMTVRAKELQEHLAALNLCGEVFERASKDVHSLDDQFTTVQTLPGYVTEFDSVVSSTSNDVESLQQNESALRDAAAVLTESNKNQRVSFNEVAESAHAIVLTKQKEVDVIFVQMLGLLRKAEETYAGAVELFNTGCKNQLEVAKCDHRAKEIAKAVELEVQKQQKYSEGTRLTIFLAGKAKDLFRKLYSNMEESMRARRELCERTKLAAQEQLYSMAENLHDVVTKRMNADNLSMRNDQQSLDSANRSLMGLVHVPNEMEKQMENIKRLTLSISSAKHRMNQSQADIQTIRQILSRFGTLQFLKRESNFLSVFDGVERQAKLKERLDDASQKIKFVSEVLVEISDPETRQDYVVHQAIEALKQTVADVNDLLPSRGKIEDLDEQYRLNMSTRLKRYKRLMTHFLDEVREGTNDLNSKEPSIEVHTMALMDGLQVILSALTHNEEPVPAHLRSAYLQSAAGGAMPVQSYYDPVTASAAAAAANSGGMASQQQQQQQQSLAPQGAQKTFGGGAGTRSLSMLSPGDILPAFEEAEQAVHIFARASDRLKISHESRRVTKVPGGMEMSNTSALGAVGFRLGTGIHYYTIRIGQNCSRLLVGFADWNLPLDGYCNSIKYAGCYYLHIGNGTLWCPDQKIERRHFTYEAIGSTTAGQLKCIVDTNERSIGFVWNDINLGVAFRNVNLSRTLYPAFEVFSNNCSFEFVQAKPASA